MNKPKITEPRGPVLAWQRGPLRVVAQETLCEHGNAHGFLTLEERFRDRMGESAWMVVPVSEIGAPIIALVCEVVSRVEAIPKWVRDLAQEKVNELAAMDSYDDVDDDDEYDGGDGDVA